jgi:hypothetical protein
MDGTESSLRYWINSIGIPSCLLVDDLRSDLRDGIVICDIVSSMGNIKVSNFANSQGTDAGLGITPASKIQAVLHSLGLSRGFNALPPAISKPVAAAEAISNGSLVETIALLQYLKSLHGVQQNNPNVLRRKTAQPTSYGKTRATEYDAGGHEKSNPVEHHAQGPTHHAQQHTQQKKHPERQERARLEILPNQGHVGCEGSIKKVRGRWVNGQCGPRPSLYHEDGDLPHPCR